MVLHQAKKSWRGSKLARLASRASLQHWASGCWDRRLPGASVTRDAWDRPARLSARRQSADAHTSGAHETTDLHGTSESIVSEFDMRHRPNLRHSPLLALKIIWCLKTATSQWSVPPRESAQRPSTLFSPQRVETLLIHRSPVRIVDASSGRTWHPTPTEDKYTPSSSAMSANSAVWLRAAGGPATV